MSSSDIEMYGISSTPDLFHIDDLLDFSNEDLFSSSSAITTTTITTDTNFHLPLPATETTTTDPTDNFLCVPNDDIAELEWLSNFVDEDSFSNFSLTNLTTTTNTGTTSTTPTNTTISVPGKARSKRPKPTTLTHHSWTTSSSESDISAITKSTTPCFTTTSRISNKNRGERDRERDLVSSSSSSSSSSSRLMRKCSHCASEKTPQWRTGPMGPKTLCNACGVRYKSGRLVPEYRPAASPTFVLTQHSNSHRKVMELRRQKEEEVVVMDMDMDMEDNNNCHEFFRHHRDFKVC